ncbi:protein Skeletor, isoforms B/C-like [Brevipalpus obovatus]|uniref:protein Skeletor, isoforms B/C-like n=1 Tax=Brevipalpus obovatus TaxID=246614 RepID=UPI003D9F7BC9
MIVFGDLLSLRKFFPSSSSSSSSPHCSFMFFISIIYTLITSSSILCLVNSINLNYYGKYLGSFSPTSVHSVKGKVYAVNETAIFIQDFSYDGAGPDAYFWAGSSSTPDVNGFIIPDSLGRYDVLKGYSNQNVLLNLPKGRTIKTIKWISIWCRSFTADFGHVKIPPNFEPPKPLNLGPIRGLAHGVSASGVIIMDAKTVFIKNLYYDGAAPDAFFMAGTGDRPQSRGQKVPDENGSLEKIHGYAGADVYLRLPRGLTVMDIDWFGLYCITYREDFGHVKIPKNLNVPPDYVFLESKVEPFMSCLTIFPGLMQISWEVRDQEIFFQLEGKVEPNQYLAFGLSGSSERPEMIGADVAVTFYDTLTSTVQVVDYTLRHKSQCAPQTNSGACPDDVTFGGRQDLIMVSGNYLNGYLKAIYKRNVVTGDMNADQDILPDEYATIVAAVGPVNSRRQAAYHNIKYTRSTDLPIRVAFNKIPLNRNCSSLNIDTLLSSSTHSSIKSRAWKHEKIRNANVFRLQIGPAGGDRGYTAITGIQSWGIAWWVNGKLIPEIHVQRGKNYTFIVEGGNDPSNQAQYHPLYITESREGGGGQEPAILNSPGHRVFAGIIFNRGVPDPAPGAGRYCEWKHRSGIDRADDVDSVDEYKETLRLECKPGSPAVFTWSPDHTTPDVVYYQCYTHRNLGWKIIVNHGISRTGSIFTLIVMFMVYTILR